MPYIFNLQASRSEPTNSISSNTVLTDLQNFYEEIEYDYLIKEFITKCELKIW